MSAPPADAVVHAFLDALEQRDFERAASYLSRERFSYIGPTSRFDNAADFLSDISRIGPILKSIQRRRTFVEGNEVMVVFDFIATIPELSNSRVAELVRVEEGLITYMELFFDAHAYVSMFEHGTPL
ncbi:nuclear transport factor 2 family protein [Thioalbus denitrificans]|uniref:SnoaL-like protein n=1 Tax=Thioalbus denitrificans TaxID=547122 RepID=A0A369BU66_9GAMM|nr:nuclear transport factor 2 family protein [Thioalbus denitrificans]RCX24921.1 SnoaL-like protein [Thioalbus denitrificans]